MKSKDIIRYATFIVQSSHSNPLLLDLYRDTGGGSFRLTPAEFVAVFGQEKLIPYLGNSLTIAFKGGKWRIV